jgi:predicted alpha/beta-hydrolase family hydrolase
MKIQMCMIPSQKMVRIFLGAFIGTLGAQAVFAEPISVATTSGGKISAIADFPVGDGKHPAIVLAPGQGYHMTLPAMESTAKASVEQGIAVFRFNWTYFSAEPKGQPSEDLSKELQDLQTMLAAARKHPRVLAQSVSVGGKSLGSIVAWRAFTADPQLRSALLLTPVCSRVPKGETKPKPEAKDNYAGFDTERRPSLWISGDKDPLCAAPVMYAFAATSPGAARVAFVGGDHGYENRLLPQAAAEVASKRNITAVSVLASSFVAEIHSAQP